MNTAAKLTSTVAPDYAGTPLTRWSLSLGDEQAFQDVDRWGLPYAGSPASDLYDDLCDRLIVTGRLDADALNSL